jgi:CBS-domain-containing membrane protein
MPMRQFLVFAYRAAGAGVAIGIMEWLSVLAGEPFWRVPFVTSIVLVMTIPQSEAARPYAVVAGHASACVAGFLALYLFGAGATASAVGVGAAGLLMLSLRAPHPPAGIDAFLIAANGLSLRWAVSPVLVGCVLLVAFAQAWAWGEQAIFPPRDSAP